MLAMFWLRSRKEEDRFKDISVSGSIILNWILKIWTGKPQTRLILLRVGKSGILF